MTLFPTLVKPRRKPRKLMQVMDAGEPGVRLRCKACEHETGWVSVAYRGEAIGNETLSHSQARKGWPCPYCNADTPPLAEVISDECYCVGCDPSGESKAAYVAACEASDKACREAMAVRA